jgi:hypothetical protein
MLSADGWDSGRPGDIQSREYGLYFTVPEKSSSNLSRGTRSRNEEEVGKKPESVRHKYTTTSNTFAK